MTGSSSEDLRSRDVGGHEVGRELDAAELEIEDPRERGDQERLGEPGDAHHEAVAVREENREQLLHDSVLTHDHLAQLGQDLRAGALELLEKAHVALRG